VAQAQAKKKSTHEVLPAPQESTPQRIRRALNCTTVRPKPRKVHSVDTNEDDQLRQLKKVEEGHCNAPDEELLQGAISPPSLSLETVSVSEWNADEETTDASLPLPHISCVSRSQVINDPAL
jgi:hypothetical protein